MKKNIKFTEEEIKELKEQTKVELINKNVSDQIDTALSHNVDLSEEEYKKNTGSKVRESLRHKRVQSNFYGTQLNFNYQILQSLYQQEILLGAIYEELKKKNK